MSARPFAQPATRRPTSRGWALVPVFLCACALWPAAPASAQSNPSSFRLVVEEGTPLRVALARRVVIKRVGQPIDAVRVDPVFAYDRIVLPAATRVLGRVARRTSVSKKRRTLAMLSRDFTPLHDILVQFETVVLPDGRSLPVTTLDEVFVLNFADTPRIDVPLTNDVRVLEAGVTRVDAIGGTALRDALLAAERYLRQHATLDRRALFVLTDGIDNASTLSASECRKLVERRGAAIYAVRLVRDTSSADAGGNDDELARLAEVSGGIAVQAAATSNIEPIAAEMAHRIRGEYTIAYTPAKQALDGSYRAVRVKVTRPGGLTAKTRHGYRATPLPEVPSRQESGRAVTVRSCTTGHNQGT